jgi:hypothetical protein
MSLTTLRIFSPYFNTPYQRQFDREKLPKNILIDIDKPFDMNIRHSLTSPRNLQIPNARICQLIILNDENGGLHYAYFDKDITNPISYLLNR